MKNTTQQMQNWREGGVVIFGGKNCEGRVCSGHTAFFTWRNSSPLVVVTIIGVTLLFNIYLYEYTVEKRSLQLKQIRTGDDGLVEAKITCRKELPGRRVEMRFVITDSQSTAVYSIVQSNQCHIHCFFVSINFVGGKMN
eukprot:GEMP01085226.1.p1 GENE.GEMP01085226.1~~GEMP01085226.1.p1  ORF type:complete len:139 (-),score=5.48 GEMP01085226.1:7-423(-)